MLDMETTIIKHKKEVNYTTIYNDCINDRKLKTDSLAILVYVMSKPDDWEIKIKELSNRFTLGRDSVDRAVKELVSAGYMQRVQKRVNDGSFARLVISASDKPIFLQETKNQPCPEIQDAFVIEKDDKQPFTEIQETVTEEKTNKQPFTENPLTVFQETIPYIQKKDITKNNNNLSTAREEAPTENGPVDFAVAVFLLDKIRNLPNFDITTEKMNEWVLKHGKNYVESKIELMKSKTKILSQGAYLKSALEYDWGNINKSSPTPLKCEISMVKEDVISKEGGPTYDREWFMGLSEKEKTEIYSDAAKAWPTLPAMLEKNKLSVLDPEFIKSPWVNPMIDTFRNYRRL